MKTLIFSILFATHFAFATSQLNFITCTYNHFENEHSEGGWELFRWQSSIASFHLNDGETKMISGMWTSGKKEYPNVGLCTAMTGTNDDNVILMTSYIAHATSIENISGICDISGADVIPIEKKHMPIARGSIFDVESDWLNSPAPTRVRLRTYIPHLDELDRINEIAEEKCMELL